MLHKPARWAMLLLVLLAFGRLVSQLDAKDLWLDEGFSLQRAESSWPVLLSGQLAVAGAPGSTSLSTHPPAYFILLKLVLAIAGSSAFSLRFPSVMAATLLVPCIWALARRLARARALPAASPWWAALLSAASPFYLWAGQEARMYALVALLAVMSTYFLLRWTATETGNRSYLVAYLATMVVLLSSHFFSVLILPVHAGVVFQAHRRRASFGRSLIRSGEVLALGLIPVAVGVWELLFTNPSRLEHFVAIPWDSLAIGLLQTFSLGFSLSFTPDWWLLLLILMLLLGTGWAFTRRPIPVLGWLLPAWLVVPPLLLYGINRVHPAYTNARELSLVSGAFLLLVGGGLAWIWQRSRWVSSGLALVLLAGMAYSTVNLFTLPDYGKGDLSGMGDFLRRQVLPGDLVLTEPEQWWRLYSYYLPLDLLERGAATGSGTAWRNTPGTFRAWPSMDADMSPLISNYHRIWLVSSDPKSPLAAWLAGHASRVQSQLFASPLSLLKLELFITRWPVLQGSPEAGSVQHPVDVTFGNRLRLVGYGVGRPLATDSTIPITMYWQSLAPISAKYKYRLSLMETGTNAQVAVSDHDFDGGFQPTTAWKPGTTIVEHTGIMPPKQPLATGYYLALVAYDARTLDRLPADAGAGAKLASDGSGRIVILPLVETNP
jgi:mannosyltransferase